MLKDITLGQFFPGDTLAHKLDPRTKLLVTVLYVVALFTAKSYIAYGVLILTLIVAVRISRVGAKALFKGLKPVLFIIAFTALLNLFYTPGTELCHFWIFRITIEGVRAAITMMLRITLLIMGTFLLTYTTSPIRLTDGLESLLGPLKKIKVPVHELVKPILATALAVVVYHEHISVNRMVGIAFFAAASLCVSVPVLREMRRERAVKT